MLRMGGCQCGQARYESAGAPLGLYICHCRECQKQSASAFGMSLQVTRAGLRLVKGLTQSWSRAADSGRIVVCVFCPRCGSRLWHESDPPGDTVFLRAGSLDTPPNAARAIHIWTSRKVLGVVIPADATQFPQEPA